MQVLKYLNKITGLLSLWS